MSMPFIAYVKLNTYLASDILIDQLRKGIVAQLAEAMTRLHAINVDHLDMKRGHVLWE